jgi:hypothetical protein
MSKRSTVEICLTHRGDGGTPKQPEVDEVVEDDDVVCFVAASAAGLCS